MAKNTFMKVILGLGIVVVIGLFAGFGGDYIGNYFQDKCNEESNTQGSCQGIQGLGCETFTTRDTCPSAEGGCYWQEPYNQQCFDNKQMYFSIFAAIVGIITLGIGLVIKENNSVGGGLIGGGIVSLITSLFVYWSNINGLLRVVLMGVLVIVLIIIGFKKFSD